MPFATAGSDVATVGVEFSRIPLKLSYRMIELFSGQLYSSPAKAIEELVVNSYDAFAHSCQVGLPDTWSTANACVTVWDDGESMDLEGLKDLWWVAGSNKRTPENEARAAARGRQPIGKFGIGKLASYVLGRRISHVCKKDNRILGVTMDFSRVVPQEGEHGARSDDVTPVTLSVRSLGAEDLGRLLVDYGVATRLPQLGREDEPSSWTLVLVDHLKPEAARIQLGRLRWIISTALPNVPDFSVAVNGGRIESARALIPVVKSWVIGVEDQSARQLGYDTRVIELPGRGATPAVEVPGVGPIWGSFDLHEDSLLGGKAGEVGRSNGFFIMVRNRLVNYQDPLFGLPALTYGPFSRLHAVVNAEGLDRSLVASRENVADEPRLALQTYLSTKFQEVRSAWEEYEESNRGLPAMEVRLKALPGALARYPLKRAVDRIVSGGGGSSGTIRTSKPGEGVKDEVSSFSTAAPDPAEPLAYFDYGEGSIVVNPSHPFYANSDDTSTADAIATAEVLLEAYLRETGLPEAELLDVLRKRDDLLRALVRQAPKSVLAIAQSLREAAHDERGLENACHTAFAALGFEVLKLGSKGDPEGVASAPLATKFSAESEDAQRRSYSLTYDAKSTHAGPVKSGNVGMATIARHRGKYGAKYAVVVADQFQDTLGDEAKVVQEAREQGVTLVRIVDFARLIEASGARPLPLTMLEDLFKTCRSPDESGAWIDTFSSRPPPKALVPVILHAIARLQREHPEDQPSFAAVKHIEPRLSAVPERQIRELAEALQRLVPDLIAVYGDRVELNQSPENVLVRVRRTLDSATP